MTENPYHKSPSLKNRRESEPGECSMSPEDWFGVGVRWFGMLPLLLAVQNVIYAIDVFAYGYFDNSILNVPANSASGYVIYAIGYFLLALATFRLAPLLVAFSYPSSISATRDEDD